MSSYNVEENGGSIDLALILSNPSSIPIAIQILTTDGSTNGNWYTIYWLNQLKYITGDVDDGSGLTVVLGRLFY